MRFKTTLPKGCMVKAGSIPVRLLGPVECETETPIKVDLVSGVGLMAMADEQSIDDINNNPNNAYHKPNKTLSVGDSNKAPVDYAYKTIEEFERIVGYKVADAFRVGWDMARTTNKTLGIQADCTPPVSGEIPVVRPSGLTTKAQKECCFWLTECLRLGWKKEQLDNLENLWWKYHDRLGNLA